MKKNLLRFLLGAFMGMGLLFSCTSLNELLDTQFGEKDTAVPFVMITSPTNGAIVNTETITLSGTSDIQSPNTVSKVEVQLNGGEWANATGTAEWSVEISLNEGTNVILARATADNAKTAVSDEWNVIYDPSMPSITIVSHENGDFVNTVNISFSGTAFVQSPHSITLVEVQLNGGEWAEATGTDNWSINLNLNEGANTVLARVEADNGKTSSSALIIINLDTIAPMITISSPTNGQEVGSSYQFMGTVSDNFAGVDKVFYNTDGGEWFEADIDGTNWSVIINVDDYGQHTNRAFAIDMVGNSSSTNFVWIERTSVPSINITSHFNGEPVLESEITLEGTASVDTPYIITSVEVKLNEEGWESATGTDNWSANLSLNEGKNTIIARAHSDSGKSASVEWTIYYDPAIFVCTTGNDENSGTRLAPVKSIQTALSKAQTLGLNNIYVASGRYIRGTGLNASSLIHNYSGVRIGISDITLLGGWNSSFSERTGKSELDAESGLYHVIWIDNVDNVTIDGFIIRNGNANDSTTAHQRGGGIYIDQGNGHTIQNTEISENRALTLGGGVYINQGENHTVDTTINLNLANNNHGGGIYLHQGTSHTIKGNITDNTANQYGGGVYISAGTSHTVEADISGNTANTYGGGVYITGGNTHIIDANISGNTGNTRGGGVYINQGTSFTISGTIADNESALGGGVYIWYGTTHTLNGSIIGNNSTTDGGGVCVWYGTTHTINATIKENSAIRNGGGIYMERSSGHSIGGTISGNTANTNGGGIYVNIGTSYTLSGTISSNSARNGGGMFVNQGTGHNVTATLNENSATQSGGGVYLNNSTNNSLGGNIKKNTANNGGGVYLSRGSLHTLNATISENTALIGGGVYIDIGKDHTIRGNISGNTASSTGGGLYLLDINPNTTLIFNAPTIQANSNYGISRYGSTSFPQGLDTINWGTGNSPANKNW
jgi:hypothetical protein